jgi:hypothetical protein
VWLIGRIHFIDSWAFLDKADILLLKIHPLAVCSKGIYYMKLCCQEVRQTSLAADECLMVYMNLTLTPMEKGSPD